MECGEIMEPSNYVKLKSLFSHEAIRERERWGQTERERAKHDRLTEEGGCYEEQGTGAKIHLFLVFITAVL